MVYKIIRTRYDELGLVVNKKVVGEYYSYWQAKLALRNFGCDSKKQLEDGLFEKDNEKYEVI